MFRKECAPGILGWTNDKFSWLKAHRKTQTALFGGVENTMKSCAWFSYSFPYIASRTLISLKEAIVFAAASYISSIIKCTTDKTRMFKLSQCHQVQRRLFLGVRGA